MHPLQTKSLKKGDDLLNTTNNVRRCSQGEVNYTRTYRADVPIANDCVPSIHNEGLGVVLGREGKRGRDAAGPAPVRDLYTTIEPGTPPQSCI